MTQCVIKEAVTLSDVVPVDPDVLVAVAAGVFVVEAQRVQQFVLDDAVLHAAEPLQRQHLFTSRRTQYRSTANGKEQERISGQHSAGQLIINSIYILASSCLHAEIICFLGVRFLLLASQGDACKQQLLQFAVLFFPPCF